MLHELLRQRDELSAELNELQSVFGGSATAAFVGKRGPGRPPGSGRKFGPLGVRRGPGRPPGTGGRGHGANKTNLVTALHNTLNGRTLSVVEVAEAVQKDGYKTKSENFRTIVNQALLANPTVFRKVARGQYTSK